MLSALLINKFREREKQIFFLIIILFIKKVSKVVCEYSLSKSIVLSFNGVWLMFAEYKSKPSRKLNLPNINILYGCNIFHIIQKIIAINNI
jgi:hypothetical protein